MRCKTYSFNPHVLTTRISSTHVVHLIRFKIQDTWTVLLPAKFFNFYKSIHENHFFLVSCFHILWVVSIFVRMWDIIIGCVVNHILISPGHDHHQSVPGSSSSHCQWPVTDISLIINIIKYSDVNLTNTNFPTNTLYTSILFNTLYSTQHCLINSIHYILQSSFTGISSLLSETRELFDL